MNCFLPRCCSCFLESVTGSSLINNLEKRDDCTNSIFMGCRVVISVLSALQADSETSRSWHPFRELLLPKAVTTCLDRDPTEWERQRRNNAVQYEVFTGRNTPADARKEAYSLLKRNRCQCKLTGRPEECL